MVTRDQRVLRRRLPRVSSPKGNAQSGRAPQTPSAPKWFVYISSRGTYRPMGMRTHATHESPHERSNSRTAGLWLALLTVGVQCAPVIKRDISKVPAGQVGFDDLCGLQPYFDRLALKIGTPP